MILNQEAHELSPEKQQEALDFVQDASDELKSKLAPIWKYCFVQWHIYDVGLEALDRGAAVHAMLSDPDLLADIDNLKTMCDSGDLDEAATAENWTWKLLDPLPEAGSLVPWTDEVSTNLLKDCKEERHEGVLACDGARYDKALWHFMQGLRLMAPAPAIGGPVAKMRGDLYKNKSAAALKLGLKRMALHAANGAIALNSKDEKAWYRKASALDALGNAKDYKLAMDKAGLAPPPKKPPPRAKKGARMDALAKPGVVVEEIPDELDPTLDSVFESLTFVEIGVDSVAAVELIRFLQAELRQIPLPLTFIYDFPQVKDAVTVILKKINSGKACYLRRRMTSLVWKATKSALGKDPMKGRAASGPTSRNLYTEEEAMEILSDLQMAYEEKNFVKMNREIARQSAFEQRTFLVNLRPKALVAQTPILRRLGYSENTEGLRQLETSLIDCARKSERVKEKLKLVRIALQGGANGMWAINVESDAPAWSDSQSMQLRSIFEKADPFGARRVNTNAVAAF